MTVAGYCWTQVVMKMIAVTSTIIQNKDQNTKLITEQWLLITLQPIKGEGSPTLDISIGLELT